jgi:hypothetical protein
MCRCLEGSIAKRAAKPGVGRVLAQYRKRAQVHQGRPQKAVLVQDALYDWFCSIKRIVMTRLPPKLVLGKAQALMEEWVGEHVQRGLPAVAGSISGVWLLRWQPNRKWSVPRNVQSSSSAACMVWDCSFPRLRCVNYCGCWGLRGCKPWSGQPHGVHSMCVRGFAFRAAFLLRPSRMYWTLV